MGHSADKERKEYHRRHGHSCVRAMVIHNPRAGKGGTDITPALAVLREEGWDITLREKRHDGDGMRYAKKAVKRGYDAVIASGGDGTVNEVMSGLVGSNVPLGVFPIGTVNLWASELGFDQRLDVVARQLVLGEQRKVDVGRLTVNGGHAAYFLLLAGLGADAAILDHTSRSLKNRIGSIAVAVAAAQVLPALDVVPIRASIDGMPWYGHSGQIIVGNSRRYGGFTSVTGCAYIDDGLLDMCIFTTESLIGAARQAGSLLLRRRPDPTSAEVYRASSITIQALRPLPLEVDGSGVDKHQMPRDARKGHKPIVYAFEAIPEAVRVIVPRTYNGELFQPAPLTTTFALGDVRPASSQPSANGDRQHEDINSRAVRHNGHNSHHHRHNERQRMRVLAIGVDTLLAQHLPDGRAVTVRLGRRTNFAGSSGATVQSLMEGDIVEVKGKRDQHTGTLKAKRITLVDVPAGR